MVDVEGKRIFLSGPMSGRKWYNVGEFCNAHAALREAGAGFVFNPALEYLDPAPHMVDATHEEYMLRCIDVLSEPDHMTLRTASFDMVVRLPGWDRSDGATVESVVAEACGIPVYDIGEVIEDWEQTQDVPQHP